MKRSRGFPLKNTCEFVLLGGEHYSQNPEHSRNITNDDHELSALLAGVSLHYRNS